MKKKIIFWALKDRKGNIISSTVQLTKFDCWEQGFWVVSSKQGEKWRADYWCELNKSIRSAEKLGYKFCRVEIKEIK